MHTAPDPLSSRVAGRVADVLDGPLFDEALRALATEPATRAAAERDDLPVPAAADREGYYDDRHWEYWLSGRRDYLQVRAHLPAGTGRRLRLLDFGGATGRVFRHFLTQDEAAVTLCDVKASNVSWVRTHFPASVEAHASGVGPPLPLPTASCDVVTAFSVFTHIDDAEHDWLEELRRVLRPGGLLYLTVHDESTWSVLPSTFVHDVLRQSPDFDRIVRSMPTLEQRVAFRYHDGPVYNCNVFHPTEYIRVNWGRAWDVGPIVPFAHEYQTAVVLRRRPS